VTKPSFCLLSAGLMEVAGAQMNQVLSCKGPLRLMNSPTSGGEAAARIAGRLWSNIYPLHRLSRRAK
jgi:hypothetical protein